MAARSTRTFPAVSRCHGGAQRRTKLSLWRLLRDRRYGVAEAGRRGATVQTRSRDSVGWPRSSARAPDRGWPELDYGSNGVARFRRAHAPHGGGIRQGGDPPAGGFGAYLASRRFGDI